MLHLGQLNVDSYQMIEAPKIWFMLKYKLYGRSLLTALHIDGLELDKRRVDICRREMNEVQA